MEISERTEDGSVAVRPVRIDVDAYYSDDDVAALLGVSTDTLRRHRQTKVGLPFSKFGRRIFYRGADIKASLDMGRCEPTPSARWADTQSADA